MVYKVLWHNMLQIRPRTPTQTPSLYDKFLGLLYMHSTLSGNHPLGDWLVEQTTIPSHLFTQQLWLRALIKGSRGLNWIRTHTLLLTTPELGSSELDHSATTRERERFSALIKGWRGLNWIRTHTLLLTTPELGSSELDSSATTHHSNVLCETNKKHYPMIWFQLVWNCGVHDWYEH